jgi:hypothetical protein
VPWPEATTTGLEYRSRRHEDDERSEQPGAHHIGTAITQTGTRIPHGRTVANATTAPTTPRPAVLRLLATQAAWDRPRMSVTPNELPAIQAAFSST